MVGLDKTSYKLSKLINYLTVNCPSLYINEYRLRIFFLISVFFNKSVFNSYKNSDNYTYI